MSLHSTFLQEITSYNKCSVLARWKWKGSSPSHFLACPFVCWAPLDFIARPLIPFLKINIQQQHVKVTAMVMHHKSQLDFCGNAAYIEFITTILSDNREGHHTGSHAHALMVDESRANEGITTCQCSTPFSRKPS